MSNILPSRYKNTHLTEADLYQTDPLVWLEVLCTWLRTISCFLVASVFFCMCFLAGSYCYERYISSKLHPPLTYSLVISFLEGFSLNNPFTAFLAGSGFFSLFFFLVINLALFVQGPRIEKIIARADRLLAERGLPLTKEVQIRKLEAEIGLLSLQAMNVISYCWNALVVVFDLWLGIFMTKSSSGQLCQRSFSPDHDCAHESPQDKTKPTRKMTSFEDIAKQIKMKQAKIAALRGHKCPSGI